MAKSGTLSRLHRRSFGLRHITPQPAALVRRHMHYLCWMILCLRASNHIKVHASFQDSLEVAQGRTQMLRQRAVAVVAPSHVLRKGQANIDDGHCLIVGFAQCIGGGAGQVNQLLLIQLKAIGPVVCFVHGVPHVHHALVGADMVPVDLRCSLAQLGIIQVKEPLRVDLLVAEPQRMPLSSRKPRDLSM